MTMTCCLALVRWEYPAPDEAIRSSSEQAELAICVRRHLAASWYVAAASR